MAEHDLPVLIQPDLPETAQINDGELHGEDHWILNRFLQALASRDVQLILIQHTCNSVTPAISKLRDTISDHLDNVRYAQLTHLPQSGLSLSVLYEVVLDADALPRDVVPPPEVIEKLKLQYWNYLRNKADVATKEFLKQA